MNVACDDAMLMQANEDTSSYIKNEKYYSFNNLARKSIKNAEQEAKNINRLKRLIFIKITDIFLNFKNISLNININITLTILFYFI